MALPSKFVNTCPSLPGSPMADSRQTGRDLAQELQPFGPSLKGEQRGCFLNHGLYRERDPQQPQLASFNSRNVKNIVDQQQQGIGRPFDRPGIFLLLRLSSVPRRKSVIPKTPFMGVRISWLMFARKRLFILVASRAVVSAVSSLFVLALQLQRIAFHALFIIFTRRDVSQNRDPLIPIER